MESLPDNNLEKVAFGSGFTKAMKTLGGGKALAGITAAVGIFNLAKRPKLIKGSKYRI